MSSYSYATSYSYGSDENTNHTTHAPVASDPDDHSSSHSYSADDSSSYSYSGYTSYSYGGFYDDWWADPSANATLAQTCQVCPRPLVASCAPGDRHRSEADAPR